MIPAIIGALSRVAQFGLNQMAINRQNRYNSPVAQVGRLKKAGLNPALLYQNIQPDTQTQPNSYSDSTIAHDITSYLEHQTSQYNAETQRFAQKSNQGKTEEEIKALRMANEIQEALKSYIDKNPDSYYLPQVKRALAEYNQIISNTNLSDQQHEINRVNQELAQTKFWHDIELSEETKNQIIASTEETKARTEILRLDKLNYAARYLAQQKPWFIPLIEKVAGDLGITVDKFEDMVNNIADWGKNEIARAKYGIDFDDAKAMQPTDLYYKGNPVLKRVHHNKIKTDNGYVYSDGIPDFYVIEKKQDGEPYYRKLDGHEINRLSK